MKTSTLIAISSSAVAVMAGPVSKRQSQTLIDAILSAHNEVRALHGSSDLSWDSSLADSASVLGATCTFDHDTSIAASIGSPYGQNLAYIGSTGELPSDVDMATDSVKNGWYADEIDLYPGYGSEPDMSNFSAWGHFSQVVWAATSKVGCVVASCPSGMTNGGSYPSLYLVCNYYTAGNFAGEYAENVLPPGSASSETTSSAAATSTVAPTTTSTPPVETVVEEETPVYTPTTTSTPVADETPVYTPVADETPVYTPVADETPVYTPVETIVAEPVVEETTPTTSTSSAASTPTPSSGRGKHRGGFRAASSCNAKKHRRSRA